jgi:hypothetical protein
LIKIGQAGLHWHAHTAIENWIPEQYIGYAKRKSIPAERKRLQMTRERGARWCSARSSAAHRVVHLVFHPLTCDKIFVQTDQSNQK